MVMTLDIASISNAILHLSTFQVGDLRSQVIREACLTIGRLSEAIPSVFESLSELFLPSLFKLLYVTIQVN